MVGFLRLFDGGCRHFRLRLGLHSLGDRVRILFQLLISLSQKRAKSGRLETNYRCVS